MRDLLKNCYEPGIHDISFDIMHRLCTDTAPGTDAAMAMLKEYDIDIDTLDGTALKTLTVLHCLIEEGKLNAVKCLIEHGANIRTIGSNGQNILHTAAKAGQCNMLKYLLGVEERPDIQSRADDRFSLFHFAALGGNVKILQLLSELKCFDPNDTNLQAETALHIATRSGKLDAVKFLLMGQTDDIPILATSQHSLTLLHHASIGRNFKITKLLLAKGCFQVNSTAESGDTALHIAANCGKVDAIKCLLAHGARNDLLNHNYENILHKAAQSIHLDVFQYLLTLEHMPEITARSQMGHSVFHYAALGGNTDILEFLLKMNCFDINDQTDQGETALHIAVRYGKFDAVVFLFKHGADTKKVDNDGRTVIHHAAEYGEESVFDYLIKNAIIISDITMQSHVVGTCFHCAAIGGNVKILQRLAAMKCFDVDDKTEKGETALHIAARCNKPDAVQHLIDIGACLNIVDRAGRDVIHIAAHYGSIDVFRVLVKVKTNKQIENSVMHEAASNGNIQILDILVKMGRKYIDAPDSDCDSALHIAVRCGRLDAAKFLVEHGCDTKILGHGGNNIMHQAAQYGRPNILKYLLTVEGMVNVTQQSHAGFSLLHSAAFSGNTELLELILRMGCFDVNDKITDEETALHVATRRGNLDAVECLLTYGDTTNAVGALGQKTQNEAENTINKELIYKRIQSCIDINAKKQDGGTALQYALLKNNFSIVKYLIENGCDIYQVDNRGRNALDWAAEHSDAKIFQHIRNASLHRNIDLKSSDGYALLHHAAAGGNTNVLKLLLAPETDDEFFYDQKNKTVDVNIRTRDGETALHIAAANGKFEAVQFLLEHGADIKLVDNDGENVMHKSAKFGHTDLFKYLLNASSMEDIKALSKWGFTIFHYSASGGGVEALQMLAGLNIFDPNERTGEGETALHVAIRNGQLEAVKFLIQLGFDTNAVDSDENNILHVAAEYGQFSVLKYLLETGVVSDKLITAKSGDGGTLLHHAAMCCNADILKSLINPQPQSQKDLFSATKRVHFNFDVEGRSKDGLTALHRAAAYGNLEAVRFLTDHGADLEAMDNNGSNALDHAALNGQPEVLKWLLEFGGVTDVKELSKGGYSLFCNAADEGNLEVMRLLFGLNQSDPSEKTDLCEAVLQIAYREGDIDIVKFIQDIQKEAHVVGILAPSL